MISRSLMWLEMDEGKEEEDEEREDTGKEEDERHTSSQNLTLSF